MINAESLVLLVSSTLFLCYVSGILYNRTRVPDIVWLIGFGMLLGPILNIIDSSLFMGIFDLMLLVTVTLFSFATGIGFNLQQLVDNLTKAVAFAVTSFLAIALTIGYSVSFLFPGAFTLVEGLLLGCMVGGIGGLSVSGLLGNLEKLFKDLGNAGTLLSLESTLGESLRIMAVLTLIKMLTYTGVTWKTGVKDIFFTLVVSLILGIAFGLLWGNVLNRLRNRPLNYMMTIAFLFPVNVLVERVAEGGGGTIAVMVMGIVLMNYGYVSKRMGMNTRARISGRQIRQYHEEVTFLFKSLFFVYLGLIFTMRVEYGLIAMGATAIIILVRYGVATGLGRVLKLPDREVIFMRLTFIQGAGVMVLAQFPYRYDPDQLHFANPAVFTYVGIPLVFFSIIFSSVFAPEIARRQLERSKAPPLPSQPEAMQDNGGGKATMNGEGAQRANRRTRSKPGTFDETEDDLPE